MVKVYVHEGCGRCHVLEKKLQQKGIEFEEIMDTDERAKVVIEKGFMGAPIMEVDGKFLLFEEANEWANKR